MTAPRLGPILEVSFLLEDGSLVFAFRCSSVSGDRQRMFFSGHPMRSQVGYSRGPDGIYDVPAARVIGFVIK